MTTTSSGRLLAVRNQVEPRPLTVAGYPGGDHGGRRAPGAAGRPGRPRRRGGVGGWGAILAEFSETFLEAWVLPDARRQGIGHGPRRPAAWHSRATPRHDQRPRLTRVEGDEASIRFAARYGLTDVGRGQKGALDLSDGARERRSAPLPPGSS